MLNLTLPAEAGLITPQPGEVLMVTNADLREPANVTCWPTQKLFEQRLETALETLGYRLRRGPSGQRAARSRVYQQPERR
ncbi:C-compound and carbohydrate metabolism [Klebsiella michiganensis]|uniref:C-compound and carbohydrate metabolism n=1 Tax=Klebsiella michiganensis TaxID=1134687 RepID=A0A7H4N8R5_9ENTR|nr:C-compound and carbohydrate metabolism [Klebsiella michiganensis]